jgi:DNA-binding PadR family transcriptional regulator
MYGTLYNALNQLRRKGLVTKTKGLPTAERGGRSKIYYKLTREGEKALREVYRLQNSVWASIPHFLETDKS